MSPTRLFIYVKVYYNYLSYDIVIYYFNSTRWVLVLHTVFVNLCNATQGILLSVFIVWCINYKYVNIIIIIIVYLKLSSAVNISIKLKYHSN